MVETWPSTKPRLLIRRTLEYQLQLNISTSGNQALGLGLGLLLGLR